MLDLTTLKKAWALLDAQERRNALKVLAVAALSAFASTAMVGAVMPFLSVLSEPGRISEVPALAWAYERFGFASPYGFLVALGLGALVVIVLAMAILILKVYAVSRFAMMRVHSLSSRLMARYLGQPYEYFLDHHSGEMGTRVLAEAQQVVNQFLKPTDAPIKGQSHNPSLIRRNRLDSQNLEAPDPTDPLGRGQTCRTPHQAQGQR